MTLNRILLPGLALTLLLATTSWAQLSTTAQIKGTVEDSSEAVVPDATVVAHNNGHSNGYASAQQRRRHVHPHRSRGRDLHGHSYKAGV